MYQIIKLKLSAYLLGLVFLVSELYGVSTHQFGLKLNYNSIQDLSYTSMGENDYLGNGIYSWLKMDFGSMIYVNEMCMSNQPNDMARGRGKKVKGVYGFANQGYVKFKNKNKILRHNVTIGRAYIDHGFGKSARLLVSNWSRPFDQLGWQLNYKGIDAKMVGVQLDQIENINRYFAIHVIDFKFFENLTISFGESSIYAGKDRGIELQYFNPTLFWIPLRENQPNTNQANGFLYSGIKYAEKNYSFWFEYLLDDYQIDNAIQEPTTYGYIIGFEKSYFPNYFSSFWLEHSKISNRTYQTMGEFGEENYVHRGFPIGHYLGNDFDFIAFNLSSKKLKKVKYDLNYNLRINFLRDGNSGLEVKWDSPWLKLEEGEIFIEKSPTKPITQVVECALNLKFVHKKNYNFDVGLYYKSIKFENETQEDISFLLRFFLSFLSNFKY